MLRLDGVQTAGKLPYMDLVSAMVHAARELASGAPKAPEARRPHRLSCIEKLACSPRQTHIDLLQANVKWDDVTVKQPCLCDAGRSVFKSVGHASWDRVAARVALQV